MKRTILQSKKRWLSNHRLCVLYVEMPYAFSHRFLSFRWFVGLLTYPFMCGEFFSHKRIVSAFSLSHDSSSNDRFSSHARFALHGNNPLEIQLLFKSYLSLALAEKADSFRVRDSHPIPLFSEQACVSDCSGRAFATKAMLCNFRYNCSRFLRIKLRKARFLRETLHKEFPLFSSKTGTTPLIKTSPAWLNAKQKKS